MPRAPSPPFVVATALAFAAVWGGCGQTVNCENLCARTLACGVTFGSADETVQERIDAGELSEAEGCSIGCEEREVNVETASCIDAVPVTSVAECQDPVLACIDDNGG
jgi:hypothetical protein